MAKNKSSIQIRAEYLGVRFLFAVFKILPRRLGFWVADRIGDLAYRIDRSHRQVTLQNLASVFGGSTDDPATRQMARRVFRNFIRVGMELALLPSMIRSRGLDDVVEVVGREHVAAALAGGTGVVVWSAHIGNWEVIAATAEPLGMKLYSVGRAMDNPLLDRLLSRERSRYAREVIPKEGGLKKIVRRLKEGGCVAMLLDQHAGRNGIEVDFMGRPASTFRAAAEFAVRFGLPMLGGYGIRVDDTPRFRLQFEAPIYANPDAPQEEEVRRLTQEVSNSIARVVREHPEQWNWLHRRWREKKGPASVPDQEKTETLA